VDVPLSLGGNVAEFVRGYSDYGAIRLVELKDILMYGAFQLMKDFRQIQARVEEGARVSGERMQEHVVEEPIEDSKKNLFADWASVIRTTKWNRE